MTYAHAPSLRGDTIEVKAPYSALRDYLESKGYAVKPDPYLGFMDPRDVEKLDDHALSLIPENAFGCEKMLTILRKKTDTILAQYS